MKNLKICPGWIILTIVLIFLCLHRERYVATPGVVVSNSGSVDSDYENGNYWTRTHAPFQYVSPESWSNTSEPMWNAPAGDDLGCLK